MESQTDHIALYGNVRMLRSWCPSCAAWAFVMSGRRMCCGEPHAATPKEYRRMIEPDQLRKSVPKSERDKILNSQDHRCFYCDRRFGEPVSIRGKEIRLRLHWDHAVPFAHTQNNDASNFVAACHLCNGWKSSLVFQTVEDARNYLMNRWITAQAI